MRLRAYRTEERRQVRHRPRIIAHPYVETREEFLKRAGEFWDKLAEEERKLVFQEEECETAI